MIGEWRVGGCFAGARGQHDDGRRLAPSPADQTRPPWASKMRRAIARLSPQPPRHSSNVAAIPHPIASADRSALGLRTQSSYRRCCGRRGLPGARRACRCDELAPQRRQQRGERCLSRAASPIAPHVLPPRRGPLACPDRAHRAAWRPCRKQRLEVDAPAVERAVPASKLTRSLISVDEGRQASAGFFGFFEEAALLVVQRPGAILQQHPDVSRGDRDRRAETRAPRA